MNNWQRVGNEWVLSEADSDAPNCLNVSIQWENGPIRLWFGSLGIDRGVLEALTNEQLDLICFALADSADGGCWNAAVSSFWKCADYYTPTADDYIENSLIKGEEPDEEIIELLIQLEKLFELHAPKKPDERYRVNAP